MNNKTIIEFGFPIIWRIMKISEGVIRLGLQPRWITPSSISIILHKMLSLIHQLCGSRKYPYPPPTPQKIIGNFEGEGGFKGSNFRGVGGFTGNYFPKGWQTMYKTFLIGFMFYQCLLRVVTHEKCNETRVLSFPFLARPSQGPATWLVKRDNVHET